MRNQKGQESRCPTCHTPAGKTIKGKAMQTAQEAHSAAEEVKQQQAQRAAMQRAQAQQQAMRPQGAMAARPPMGGQPGMGPGAPPQQQQQGARQQIDPRMLAMLAAMAQRGGR